MAVDISKDTRNAAVGVKDLTAVINQARRLMKLELEIGQLEQATKLKQEEYDKLATETLPELMDSVGAGDAIPLGNGFTLELKDALRANIPAESTIEKADDEERPLLEKRRADAFAWLRKMRAVDIIKNTLKLDLGKGQDSLAKRFVALAKELKVPLKRSVSVAPGTLVKFIREKLEAGTVVPVDTFALFRGREATIVPPKKDKVKKEGKVQK